MNKPVVYIVIYSLYQHVYKLALSVKEGLEDKGVEVQLFQVAETLPKEVLVKMEAPPKPDIPVITVDKLAEPDGIIFGLPTRFGTMPAQVKALLDASGALWAKGALAGKFAGTFFCTASQHGGQETTAFTIIPYFAHHGMLFVPIGYSHPALGDNEDEQVIGGSSYGAGTVSDGDGSRQPTFVELDIAKHQGAGFGQIVSTFVKGRHIKDPISQSVTADEKDTNQRAVEVDDANVATETNDHEGTEIGGGTATSAAAVTSAVNPDKSADVQVKEGSLEKESDPLGTASDKEAIVNGLSNTKSNLKEGETVEDNTKSNTLGQTESSSKLAGDNTRSGLESSKQHESTTENTAGNIAGDSGAANNKAESNAATQNPKKSKLKSLLCCGL